MFVKHEQTHYSRFSTLWILKGWMAFILLCWILLLGQSLLSPSRSVILGWAEFDVTIHSWNGSIPNSLKLASLRPTWTSKWAQPSGYSHVSSLCQLTNTGLPSFLLPSLRLSSSPNSGLGFSNDSKRLAWLGLPFSLTFGSQNGTHETAHMRGNGRNWGRHFINIHRDGHAEVKYALKSLLLHGIALFQELPTRGS